jgi:uncharacterized protein YraI
METKQRKQRRGRGRVELAHVGVNLHGCQLGWCSREHLQEPGWHAADVLQTDTQQRHRISTSHR